MTYAQWEMDVPEAIRRDSLWQVEAYRLVLFLSDLAWDDAAQLVTDPKTRSAADQIFRSVCSIEANIAEGYSRSTGKERARFYEFALGSSRETRGWYYKCRRAFSQSVVEHRLDISTRLVKLLLTMVPDQRAANVKLRAPLP